MCFRLTVFLNDISKYYEKNGYSFTKVNLVNHKITNNTLYAKLEISKNGFRKIDGVVIKGYEKFPKKFIPYLLKNTKQNTFNKFQVEQISKKINTIPFVKQIKKPAVLFLKDSTLIYVYLKKNKISQFDGLIGFATDDNSKLIFNGHLNLKLNNVFNKGERIDVLWKSTTDKSKDFNFTFEVPYIFNSRINPKINFNIYSQDSSFVNVKLNSTINYMLNYQHKIGVITSFKNSNAVLKNNVENITDYSSNLFGITYTYKKYSSNIFYPNKLFFNPNLMYGIKKTSGVSYKKSEFQLKLGYLLNLNPKINFFFKNISAINISNSILENELYKIGGNTSIRGFLDKSVSASKYTVFTSDYNYNLNNTTALYSIVDYAFTYNKTNTNLFSLGIGYKTKLKSSILNINYSFGKTAHTPFDLKNALLNIRFVNYF